MPVKLGEQPYPELKYLKFFVFSDNGYKRYRKENPQWE